MKFNFLKKKEKFNFNKFKENKKATSLIISYVLLITIAIGLSIGIYSWIKSNADVSPDIDCEEDTSLIVEGYEISADNKFALQLKNNGYFNIDGFILSVGENEEEVPVILLDADDGLGETGIAGTYYFLATLEPGETLTASFFDTGVDLGELRIIQVQPFIIQKGSKVLCKDCVRKLKLEDISGVVPPIPGAFEVNIENPINGQQFPPGENINFIANQVNGVDPVTCSWESDVDNILENNLCSFNSNSLSEGEHTITVTATDSAGGTATNNLNVEIVGTGTTTNCNNLNWELIPNTQGKNFIDFEVFDGGDGALYGLTDSGTILRSENNGETWGAVFSDPNHARNLIEFDGKLIFYGMNGNLYYSSDGNYWESGSYPTPGYNSHEYYVGAAEVLENYVYLAGHWKYQGCPGNNDEPLSILSSPDGVGGWSISHQGDRDNIENPYRWAISHFSIFNGELCLMIADRGSTLYCSPQYYGRNYAVCSSGVHINGNPDWNYFHIDGWECWSDSDWSDIPTISMTHKSSNSFLYMAPATGLNKMANSSSGYGGWSSFYNNLGGSKISSIVEFNNFVLVGREDSLQCSSNGNDGTFEIVDGITSHVYAFVEYEGYIYMSTSNGIYKAPLVS